MDVKYIATTSQRLSELAIIAGQLIYLSDINASYYDMGGSRYLISSVKVVSQLPQTGQPNVIYCIINNAGHVDASVWDTTTSSYKELTGYVATASNVGMVKPDGTTITIDANGVISCNSTAITPPASMVTYDNTISGLAATNVQAALDEVNTVATTADANASTAILCVQDIYSQLQGLASTIQGMLSDIQGLSSTVTSHDTQITGLASTVAGYETRIDALEDTADIALTIESAPSQS